MKSAQVTLTVGSTKHTASLGSMGPTERTLLVNGLDALFRSNPPFSTLVTARTRLHELDAAAGARAGERANLHAVVSTTPSLQGVVSARLAEIAALEAADATEKRTLEALFCAGSTSTQKRPREEDTPAPGTHQPGTLVHMKFGTKRYYGEVVEKNDAEYKVAFDDGDTLFVHASKVDKSVVSGHEHARRREAARALQATADAPPEAARKPVVAKGAPSALAPTAESPAPKQEDGFFCCNVWVSYAELYRLSHVKQGNKWLITSYASLSPHFGLIPNNSDRRLKQKYVARFGELPAYAEKAV